MVTVNNYYNNIPVGRDLNNRPNTSSAGTTVGYQYDGLTEEDRFVQKVLQEHYDKVYKENLSHSTSFVSCIVNSYPIGSSTFGFTSLNFSRNARLPSFDISTLSICLFL